MMKQRQPDVQRPNLLMIIVDQERAVQHFPAGWEEQNMPAMQLLKQHGLTFRNAFCNACMCSPSRSTLMTSLYTTQHGVTDTLTFGGKYAVTQTDLDPNLPNIGKMLRPYYDVQYRGKWHLNKGGQNQIHGAEKALMASEVALYGFNGWIAPDSGEDMKLENFGGGYANHDARYVQEAIDFVLDWQRRKHLAEERAKMTGESPNIQPFFLVLSLVNPHDVLSYPTTYKSGGYDDTWLEGNIEPSPTASEDLALYKPSAQLLAKVGMIPNMGALNTEEKLRRYINFYGNLMSLVDNELLRLLDIFYPKNPKDTDERETTELAENTWIVRVADHGEMGTSHGGLRQKSYNVYEESLKIPMVFSRANYFAKEFAASEQMISLIDILPTLAGLVNIEQHYDIRGKDLSAYITPEPESVPLTTNHLVFTYDDVGAPIPVMPQPILAANRIRSVRTRFWKYARYYRDTGSYAPEYELYFLADVLSETTIAPTDKDAAMNNILPFDNQQLLGVLKMFPYETANFANEQFLDDIQNKYNLVDEQFIQNIHKVRAVMEALLLEKEQDLVITQPYQKQKLQLSLHGL